MLFKSTLLAQASGSIGGSTYSHNRGGMYIRNRTIPVNPNSNRQQAMRMYMDNAVQAWTNLMTEIQRNSWRIYADNVPVLNRLGDAVHLSGQQMWIRSAVPWLLTGQDLADIFTAPTTFDTGDPGVISPGAAIASVNSVSVLIGGEPAWAADETGHLLGFIGLPQNPSVRFYKSPFRFVGAVPGNATPIVSAVFDGDNANPPVPFSAGQRIFIRVRAIYPDGRLTQAFIFDTIADPV